MRRLAVPFLVACLDPPASASEDARTPFQEVSAPDALRVQFSPWAAPGQVQRAVPQPRLSSLSGPPRDEVVARTASGASKAAAQLDRPPSVGRAVPHHVLRPGPPAPVVRIRPEPAGRL